MSEPVTNAEIEDVLSSIRRLVSENNDTKHVTSVENSKVEKLVLTPAFRVLDGNGGERTIEQPETDDTQNEGRETSTNETLNQSSTETPLGLDEKIAVLEAAINDTQEDWEPDGSEEDAAEAEPIVLHRTSAIQDGEIIEPKFELTDEDLIAEHAEAKILAAVEEAEIVGEQGEIETNDVDDSDEGTFLDEEMLQEMVAHLVREELKGFVGERITRNVRRLVRREIKRALAVRDIE